MIASLSSAHERPDQQQPVQRPPGVFLQQRYWAEARERLLEVLLVEEEEEAETG